MSTEKQDLYEHCRAYAARRVTSLQAQIRELVAYAQARQVTIIPEIDIPGHASAILAAYPEFGCTEEMAEVQGNFGWRKQTTKASFTENPFEIDIDQYREKLERKVQEKLKRWSIK